MIVSYEIILTIINLTNNLTSTFKKSFEFNIEASDERLYNNNHLIANEVQMFTLFKPEINNYCTNNHVTINNIDIDEFNINSLTNRVDVYFEPGDGDDPNQISLEPNIKCYVYPQYEEIIVPVLSGEAYDNHTIIWSWEDDGQAHYIVTEPIDVEDESNKSKIIAQIPIGTNTYTETELKSNTQYTRRLISYNEHQTSTPSRPATVQTATAPIDISLEQYQVPKNYDYTSDDTEREIIQENLEAFHSGIGDYNDLKVYKQMDADFYQKFKAYIQLRGSRKVMERRYDSVGFNYKVCLESTETIEEQKGEVTFDIDVFPRENISIKDYMYASKPVTICSRLWCDVLLTQQEEDHETVRCPLLKPRWKNKIIKIPHHWVDDGLAPFDGTLSLIISLDTSGSMQGSRWENIKNAAISAINNVENFTKGGQSVRGHVKYILTFWNSDAETITASSPEHAISIINSHGAVPGAGTNHQLGMTHWMSTPVTNAIAELFFTDGFALESSDPRVEYCNNDTYDVDGAHCSSGEPDMIFESIKRSYRAIEQRYVYILTVFGADPQTDCDPGYRDAFNGAYDGQYPGLSDAIRRYDYNIYVTHYNECVRLSNQNNQAEFRMLSNGGNFNGIGNMIWDALSSLLLRMPGGGHIGHYEDDEGNNWGDVPYHEGPGGWEFEGWFPAEESIEQPVDWDIDKFKWAHVVIPPMDEDPWTFTIDESLTPIVYARNERRAIIPSDSIIRDINFDQAELIMRPAIKVQDTDLQTMILNEVQNTNEWLQGWNQVVKAYTSEEKLKGNYIIRNLFIKDTYMYADEDTIPDVDLTDDGLEDGYTGSINVYGEISKLNTTAFGDDLYVVGPDKYVYLSGYTDAIIYDGERIESFELNASHAEPEDHQTEIILSAVDNYKKFLWNRKNKTLCYKDAQPNLDENDLPIDLNKQINHVIDIILKDKDIYLTGTRYLKNAGDWELFLPEGVIIGNDPTKFVRGFRDPFIENLLESEDVIAHNDEHYQSPILNYRFNYEDPDAFTSYYELLPDCDPFSPYKNIVFVHIYYARNIYIQDEEMLSGANTVYIASFGDDNIATRSSEYYLTSNKIKGQTYFRDDYIDDYVWFQAKPMLETKAYYDEKPNPGMDAFYGNVNGRYRENNKSGKQDLRVVTPMFNLPTTIDSMNIKIYIMVTEFYPETALVSYQWDHPWEFKDSITRTNGDYVTFSSDSLTRKEVTYIELIQTINSNKLEIFDNKNTLKYFEIEKPLTLKQYDHYYIEVFSDNSDILVMNYPSEIIFDENNKAEFGANFKGVVNATTRWAPRIHNGYYYLNQHEYYAYAEFDVEANFEEYSEENFKVITGYLTIDIELLRRAGAEENYDVIKNARSELMQDERHFTWINGVGLTLLPVIDGEYYKEYTSVTYTSPIIMFPHTLTSAGRLEVVYSFDDGSTDLPMQVRSYNIEEGKWSAWNDFTNNAVPNVPLSCAYQVRFDLNASVTNTEQYLEDYLCCYLDWKDDGDELYYTNLVTVTDHLKAGPYESDGIFHSRILDFGCETTITLDIFDSNINNKSSLFIAIENYNKDKLLLENINWTLADGPITVTTRFLRYKIVIPYGEKVYWLHKNIITKKSEVIRPYVTQIRMAGTYKPVDTIDYFQEIQSFEIVTDGNEHKIFSSIYDLISGDIHDKGFEDSEIHLVQLNCSAGNISIRYNEATMVEYPSVEILNTDVYATADFDKEITVQTTPYIYAGVDPEKNLDLLKITKGTPQQYAPITMEDVNGISYREIFDVDPITLKKTEIFTIENEDDTHYIKLSRNDFDIKTLTVLLNDEPFENFNIVNNLIIFEINPEINDEIKITYNILYSFYTEIDYENDKTQMTIYSDYDTELAKQEEVASLVPIVSTSTYTDCRLDQMHTNGLKLKLNNYFVESDTNWKYEPSGPNIHYIDNLDYVSVIINDILAFNAYNMRIVAKSDDTDNDVIGFVVASKKDASNKLHTLSYVVSLGNTDDPGSILFDGDNVALIFDYGMTTEQIIETRNVPHDGYSFWNEMASGIQFHIQKMSNGLVRCQISNWDTLSTDNDLSIIEFDTESNDATQLFTDSVSYGFCVKSQKDVYFERPLFQGAIDRTITIEEQMENLKHKYKVYFETSKNTNKFTAERLSMNPVYRTDYKGFIYLTDEHNEPYKINIYRNPKYIKFGGYDKIDIAIECLDYQGNPVISKEVDIDCLYGILNFDDTQAKHVTDMNGVIHVLYESATVKCTDILTARTLTSDGKLIQASVEIVNE